MVNNVTTDDTYDVAGGAGAAYGLADGAGAAKALLTATTTRNGYADLTAVGNGGGNYGSTYYLAAARTFDATSVADNWKMSWAVTSA
jgi:hypothetical protein